MRTWDFFDTLLGRACGEPWRVFELMGGEEFKLVRQEAEQKSDKTFAGIYKSLQKLTRWSDEKIAALAAEELEWERKLAFPISANLSQVRPDDTVITDTYFDAAQIRALGDAINLPPVKIHASYGDKHHGRIWKQFKDAKTPVHLHTGDNQHADYTMARRYGIPAVWYSDGDYTPFEKTLQRAGYWDVAGLARCVRLQNPYDPRDLRAAAYHKQAAYNIPFLLLISVRLKQYMDANGREHIYFVTRDMGLVHRVFRHLYPEVSAETFYASRQTYLHASARYLDYARACAVKPKALFVDLQGTGKSALAFQDKHGIAMEYLFCAAPVKLQPILPVLYRIKSYGTELEVFNYATQGRVLDVNAGQPVRDKLEYDVTLVEAAHRAVDCLLKHVFRVPKAPTEEIMQQVFQQNRNALRALVQQHVVDHKKTTPDAA
jgi:hypothetical protein